MQLGKSYVYEIKRDTTEQVAQFAVSQRSLAHQFFPYSICKRRLRFPICNNPKCWERDRKYEFLTQSMTKN